MDPRHDDPGLDPALSHVLEFPRGSLWRNRPFVAVWSAAGISLLGSHITVFALPFVALQVLGAGPIEIGLLRSAELVAGLLVGLVAGAWVDRLRRRPVLVWSDLGRAVLLGSIPVAFVGGWLSLPQLLLVAFFVAILSTFFDVADNAYLPTIVPRDQLVPANAALTATGSAAEFTGFGLAGFLIQVLTAPIAIVVDAISFLISALLLGTIRRSEPPPPPAADREPVLQEIREGLHVVLRDPILRAILFSTMGMSALWGVFGAIFLVFVTRELGLDAATIGLVAAIGGLASIGGAVVAQRMVERVGVGSVVIGAMLLTAIGNVFIPLAPAGAPLLAVAALLVQQLVGDSGAAAFDVTERSIRQSMVADRQLGRVDATIRVGSLAAQLVTSVLAGFLAVTIGLRLTGFLAPLGALLGVAILWWSPIRMLRRLPDAEGATR
jgi:MFS family permease